MQTQEQKDMELISLLAQLVLEFGKMMDKQGVQLPANEKMGKLLGEAGANAAIEQVAARRAQYN